MAPRKKKRKYVRHVAIIRRLPPPGVNIEEAYEEARIPIKLGAARVSRVKNPTGASVATVPEIESPNEYLRTLSNIRDPSRALGFKEGVLFMIRVAEIRLAKSLGLANRSELSSHGEGIPPWWMITVNQVHKFHPPYDTPEPTPAPPQGAQPQEPPPPPQNLEEMTEARLVVRWLRAFHIGGRILWQPENSTSWQQGVVTRFKNNCVYFKVFGDPITADSRFIAYSKRHCIKPAE